MRQLLVFDQNLSTHVVDWINCVLLLGLIVFTVDVNGEANPVKKEGWRAIDQLSRWERERIDFRIDTPRDSKTGYLPAEPFPFTAPYTAEEMGYRMMEFTHTARWSHVMADTFGAITKAGYLSQSTAVSMIGQELSTQEHIHAEPGAVHARHMYYYIYPPKNDGIQELWSLRRTGLESPVKLDYFAYTPSLRRVRRQPPPRRDTPFPGLAQSFDDIIGLESWEFDWRLIGADTLYETVRFPNTRPKITLAKPNGGFYELDTDLIKPMGESYPFYRQDGGIDCFVVVATPNREWLPDYKVSKIIYWLDEHYFYPLRVETYDGNGDLKTIEVRLAKQENKALPEGHGYAGILAVYFHTQLDLISYSLHDAHMVKEWGEEDLIQFTPDFMRRRWLKYPQKSQAMVSSPEEFYMRPRLLKGKFSDERPVSVSLAIAARIAAQDKAGHLVFDVDE